MSDVRHREERWHPGRSQPGSAVCKAPLVPARSVTHLLSSSHFFLAGRAHHVVIKIGGRPARGPSWHQHGRTHIQPPAVGSSGSIKDAGKCERARTATRAAACR
jgi:hypothetical protein